AGKYDVARLDALACLQLHQQLAQVLERGRHMREHGRLVAKGSVALDELLINAGIFGWQIARGQQRHAGHQLGSSSVASGGAMTQSLVRAPSRCLPPWPPARPTFCAPMPPR